jgi:hypothetical protein
MLTIEAQGNCDAMLTLPGCKGNISKTTCTYTHNGGSSGYPVGSAYLTCEAIWPTLKLQELQNPTPVGVGEQEDTALISHRTWITGIRSLSAHMLVTDIRAQRPMRE